MSSSRFWKINPALSFILLSLIRLSIALKTIHRVVGEIKKVLVEDGQAVEFGQTLVLLK